YLGYNVNWWLMLWALVGAMLFHAAGNTLSDYFDYRQGIDASDTFGSRTLVDGVITPERMLRLSIVLLTIACLCGIGLMLVTGWQLLLFGVAGALLAVCYFFLKSHALGDVDIFLTFGFLPALGTSFVVTGAIQWEALWFVLAYIPITNAVLHANNTRDVQTDLRANIRTVPMLIGKWASQWLYCLMVIFPLMWTIVCVLLGKMPWTALLMVLALPLALMNCRMMMQMDSLPDGINALDEATAKQQLVSSLLLFIGLLLAHLL
ncbi:MAG: prenyltransferase, partial [Paludibacteraceae bacterium]|nr:prenyltransferase [Paludibacteraceae bacterium]